MPMTPKQMIKLLKQNGFYEDRGKTVRINSSRILKITDVQRFLIIVKTLKRGRNKKY